MNNVTLVGRLTRDPEMSYTTTGTAVCKFTLAVDRARKDDKTADFIDITVYSAQAENSNRYLKKGDRCGVVGRIQTGSYKNREGRNVKSFDVVASHVEFLNTRETPRNPETTFMAVEDNVPF